MSKLYTEEQLRAIYIKGVCNGRMRIEGKCSDEISSLTPIQLPTDEEVENQASKYSRIESISTQGLAGYYFEMGAKWMRDKIKGGRE